MLEDFLEGVLTTIFIAFLIILAIIGIITILALPSLIVWGVISFVIWAFSIPFTFTFWQAIAVWLILMIIGGVFKIEVNIK